MKHSTWGVRAGLFLIIAALIPACGGGGGDGGTVNPPPGSLVWARRAGGGLYDYGWGVAVLSDGSALVTGYFSGTATFGAGESNETILTSAGNVDIFLARFNQ